MAGLTWLPRGERPSVEGWYWVRPVESIGHKGDTSAIYFKRIRNRLVAMGWDIDLQKENHRELEHLRFAGPIPEPEGE